MINQSVALKKCGNDNRLRNFIHSLPTTDATPVVRCRNCESATSDHPEFPDFVLDCIVWKKCVLPDWFCCHGSQKQEGATDGSES